MDIIQIFIIGFFTIGGVVMGFFMSSKKNDVKFIKSELEKKDLQFQQQTKEKENLLNKNHELEQYIQKISIEKEQLEKYKKDFEALQQQNKIEFENLVNKIVSESQNKIKTTNQESISNILKPIQIHIDDFKKQISNFVEQDNKREGALKEKLEMLVLRTNEVSSSACELTNAIKGESVVRGSWGEETIIDILTNSGLIIGKNLFIQTQLKDNKRTDIMIKLPSGNTIIIDAKTIFVDYEKYINKTDHKEKQEALKNHIKQIETVIEDLSSKKYPDRLQENSELIEPDFTLMFVNPESALSSACHEKPFLTSAAWKKKIALVSATSLINTINIIVKLWEAKQQSDEVENIKENAQKLMTKFNNFIVNFAEAHKKVQDAVESLNTARKHIDGDSGAILPVAQKLANIYPSGITQKQDRRLLDSQGYDYDGDRK
ncbi:MAG: DNA recombination protein RmuC [Endomicrobiaceae bacterium]